MKVISILATIVASSLVGQTMAAPVANAVAERSDLNDRGLVSDASTLRTSITDISLQATMFYGCKFAPEETEVDDADPDKLKRLIKERVSLRILISTYLAMTEQLMRTPSVSLRRCEWRSCKEP